MRKIQMLLIILFSIVYYNLETVIAEEITEPTNNSIQELEYRVIDDISSDNLIVTAMDDEQIQFIEDGEITDLSEVTDYGIVKNSKSNVEVDVKNELESQYNRGWDITSLR